LKLTSTFFGTVDKFDDGVVFGWAHDERSPQTSINVDLYLDGSREATFVANLPRPDLKRLPAQNKGFRYDLASHLAGKMLSRIELYFGASNHRIPASRDAAQFVNRPTIDLRELQSIGISVWTPSPPAAIIKYISGAQGTELEQRRNYLHSGLVNSADIYNVLLDLGTNPAEPGFRIIDLGCGSGRYAPFLRQLLPNCEYLGVDVWPDAIHWAQRVISAVDPAAKFALLDQTRGYAGAKAYTLPVAPKSVQLLMAMSLFTHLNQDATLRYFHEVKRVLAEEGVALLTFFLLDEGSAAAAEAAAKRGNHVMTKTTDAWWYGKEDYLDIFYTEAFISKMLKQAGLRLVAIRRGYWSRVGADAVNLAAYQDMIMLRRAGRNNGS